MKKKDFTDVISLDTVEEKVGLYGLGLNQNGHGEVMILNGKIFKSICQNDCMVVSQSEGLVSPFLVYGMQTRWRKLPVPPETSTMESMQVFLDSLGQDLPRPFIFKLEGTAVDAALHVKMKNEEQMDLRLSDRKVEILGLFSIEDEGLITHHDAYIHAHIMTADQRIMGHLDSLVLADAGVWLPVQN